MTTVYTTILFLALSSSLSSAGELAVGRFSAGDLSGWTDKEFKGKTSYSLVKDNGTTVLKAHSVKAASGLIKEIKLDPGKYPLLRWSWKIDHPIRREDIGKKGGDDFAARVYVVFPRTFFWRMRAINYVWAAKMPKNSSAPSPYTANAIIVAVESGDEKAGKWVTEERNVYEDYRKLFNEEPPQMGAIAVMTDADDTQDETTAWYGDIFLRGAPKPKGGEKPPAPATPNGNRSVPPVRKETKPEPSAPAAVDEKTLHQPPPSAPRQSGSPLPN